MMRRFRKSEWLSDPAICLIFELPSGTAAVRALERLARGHGVEAGPCGSGAREDTA